MTREELHYAGSRSVLTSEFAAGDFWDLFAQGRRAHNTKSRVVRTCASGARIVVHFPGYKSNRAYGRYDYRVDFAKEDVTAQVKIPLSHTNVIADIHNKVAHHGVSVEDVQTFLELVYDDASPLDWNAIPESLARYEPSQPPSRELLERMVPLHIGAAPFAPAGNRWDLDVEELAACIHWIVLQEDTNYPRPRFQGRRMPLARYLEAAWSGHGEDVTIEAVVERALNKGKGRPQNLEGRDYGALTE